MGKRWRALRLALGLHPLQLLVLAACFALSGDAFYRASMGPLPLRMLIWFVAAIVGHDLVLFPLYALADRSWLVASRQVRRRIRREAHPQTVPSVNYVRVPVLFSGILLLIYYPSISRGGAGPYRAAANLSDNVFVGRWLLITGVLFAVSAVLYASRLGAATRGRRHPVGPEENA